MYYQGTGDPASRGANLVESDQKYKFLTFSPDILTHGQFTDDLHKFWHPLLLVLAAIRNMHRAQSKEESEMVTPWTHAIAEEVLV